MMFCDHSFKKKNLRNRKLNEGGYGALNPDMNTSMLKSKICLIINYSINFELFHVYNNVKWSFFQIQNNCRPKKLKKVKYAALNQNTKTSMLCLKIEIILIIISNKTFYLYHADNDVLWSFFQLQNKWITRSLKEGRFGGLNTNTNTRM